MRSLALAVLLLAPSGLLAAGTGAVKGSITSAATPGTPVVGAVVMIDGPAAPAGSVAPHATLDQRNVTFVPHVLAVPVGTTVDFPNHDETLHNVFSASPAKKFDLGMYDKGESRSVTFDTPGVVEIRCNAHPQMGAFVVVHTNPYAAVTDGHGEYTIEHVPAGRYRARIWHETMLGVESPVVVTEGQVERLDARLRTQR